MVFARSKPLKVAVLGSTGSIGRSTLDVLRKHPADFELTCVSCHQQLSLMDQQCQEFQPRWAIVTDEACEGLTGWLETRVSGKTAKGVGTSAVIEAIRGPEVDVVVAAIVGVAGLQSSLAAVESGKRLALANKESLVVAGKLLIDTAKKTGAEILPIDSEHSAIFQALQCGQGREEVDKIVLTASGGPLRDWPLEDLEKATVADALAHPTWSMGRKITVDSATMMNKALEVIEARWLFDMHAEQIQVVIHPQSVIHSMVEYRDGSVIAQLSPPDMRLPIQYALTYPKRSTASTQRVDWTARQALTWYPVDPERYPALELGFEVAKRGGTCGAVLNAANEVAVERFLDGEIRLTDIAKLCRSVLTHHHFTENPTLEELLQQDRLAREEAMRWKTTIC